LQYKLTEEEKELVAKDWGFLKPEVSEMMAFRIERDRKRKLQK